MKDLFLKNLLFTLAAPGTVVAWLPLLILPRLLRRVLPERGAVGSPDSTDAGYLEKRVKGII